MQTIIELILYFLLLLCIMLPIGYLLDRVDKRHAAQMRAHMIERYGEPGKYK